MLTIFIYLDESYNLKDSDKKQFISINGFSVVDEKSLFKKWREFRHPFALKRKRIHAKERFFDKLRIKVLKLIRKQNLMVLSVFQVLQNFPFKGNNYFYKGKLNFDKVYYDLIIELLKKLNLGNYQKVIITIDGQQHKAGSLGKKSFKKEVLDFLKKEYNKTQFSFELQPSSSNILLEIADFISNILYRAYIKNNQKFFQDKNLKITQIKNPLK